MIKHLPTYRVHEYGANVEEGYFCPACREDRLVVEVTHEHPVPDELVCPSCGAQYRSGWRRHSWGESLPKVIKGTPTARLGGVFETIQAYAAAPRLAETVDEEPLSYLADFVVDIDRDEMLDSQVSATKVWEYLDSLAPGQVRVYFSGSKGYHLIVPWQAVGVVPSATLNHREYRHMAVMVARATGVMVDYKIYSPGRMLRIPDSWHPKSGLYKVELRPEEIEGAAMLAYAPRGILNSTEPEFAPAMHELYQRACERAEEADKFSSTPQFAQESFKSAPPCVNSVITDGLPYKGSRHAVYLMLARYWLSKGVPLELFGGYNGTALVGGALVEGREFASRHDPNTTTSVNVRVREIQDVIRYVYRNNMRFSCASPKAVGLCHESCPILQMERIPIVELLVGSGIMTASSQQLEESPLDRMLI